ncbi:hypothetical protein EDM56_10720 [Brevibacillus fluminis]|uniref:WD40 repeat domain-containing protein n=1 Tax=Brevibacillus fluminis TaxID=511487 RepID=A0A3M8DNR1_9BACL|nr:hypothetical protein [Brevibacillus fluminis]RNB89644.1 hypothetical protein EDM56_10720 [Brevibacillus fluminis]
MKRLVPALMTICLLAVSPAGLIHANPVAATPVSTDWSEASYIGDISGKTHVYRNGNMKQMIMTKDNKLTVLYTAKMGVLLTPHVYPVPGQPERYLIWFEEQVGNTLTDHILVLNANGTFAEVTNMPQQGFGAYTLKWSPDGKKAFYMAENAQNHEGVIGVITPDKHVFEPIFGMIRARATYAESVVGMLHKWHADWIDANNVLLLDGRKGNFYTVDMVNKNFHASYAKTTFQVKNMKVLQGLPDYALLEVGNSRYDLGFMGTDRVHLVNWKTSRILEVPRAIYGSVQTYDQQYLGMTSSKQPVFGETVKLGNQYAFSMISLNPVQNIKKNLLVTSLRNEYLAPQSFSLSPDGSLAAVSMVNPETGAYVTFVAKTANGAVVLERKTAEARTLGWKDNQTLLLGTEAVVVKK